ncbi:15509_t:CDS:1, partial [Gigaspora rosea]
MVVMEAPLGEVMKMDAMMRSLLELFMKSECKINGANNKNDIIKVYKNGNDEEKVIESGGSSSDCRAEADDRVVNDESRSLNNNCRDFLMKQWMKKHMMFMNNQIANPAWQRNSEHHLIKMYGVTTIVDRRVNLSHAVSCNGEKIEFFKRLYLDQIAGCSSEKL